MCFQKLKEIWENFTRASESLKIGTLIGSLYPKKRMYEVKTYGEVMCHENKEQYKIWKGIDLSVQSWHEANFGSSAPKCQTFVL